MKLTEELKSRAIEILEDDLLAKEKAAAWCGANRIEIAYMEELTDIISALKEEWKL